MPKNDDVLIDLGEKVSNAQDFYSKNQNVIYIGLAAFVLLVGGLVFWKYNKTQKTAEAAVEIFESENAFAQDSFAKALLGFDEIASEYGGTPSGNLANYYAGVSSLQSGKYEDAISYLEEYDASGDIMKAMKNGVLGDAYAESGDLETALEKYTMSSNATSNTSIAPYFMNKAALLADKLGNKESSKSLFEKLKSSFPNSQEAKEASQYLARY